MILSLLLTLACTEAPNTKDTSAPPVTSTSTPDPTTTGTTGTTGTETRPTTTTTGGTTTRPTDTPLSLPPGISTWFYDQTIDGVKLSRSVYLHVPPDLADDEATPVVFAFHGNGGRATTYLASFEDYVNDGEFIGVYAQGHEDAWNTGLDPKGADDTAFVQAILDDLAAYPSADMERLYAQGFSNGAGMAHMVALRSLGFQAIAPEATALHVGDLPTRDTEPTAVLQVMGVADPMCPYDGGFGAGGLDFLSAEASAAAWAAHNGCDPVPNEEVTAEGNVRIAFTGCPEGADVVHYRLIDCGLDGPPAPCLHGWPSETEGGLQDIILAFFLDQS